MPVSEDMSGGPTTGEQACASASNGAGTRAPGFDVGVDDEPATTGAYSDDFVPSTDDVKSELWRIATGTGSETSRVSALRALADIMGLMRQTAPEFPEGMSKLLDAMARGLDSSKKD